MYCTLILRVNLHPLHIASPTVGFTTRIRAWLLCLLPISILLTFGLSVEIGLVMMTAPVGLGAQQPIKKLVHWVDILSQLLSNSCLKIPGQNPKYFSRQYQYLSLVDSNVVNVLHPLALLYIPHAVLQVTISLRQINLQQSFQQVL